MSATVRIDRKIHKNVALLMKYLDKKELKKLAKEPAKLLIQSAKANVPVHAKPHKRYLNGKVVATYQPGNLKRSIGMVNLKDSFLVWVGPRKAKGNTSGQFAGSKVDGWYGHFVEYGHGQAAHPYMRPAYENNKKAIFDMLMRNMESKFNEFNPR